MAAAFPHTPALFFPTLLDTPNFSALCQSGLEITVTDTHPGHFREIISMLSVRHVATPHQSSGQDHYQNYYPSGLSILYQLFRDTGGLQCMEERVS